jgi:Glycosyl transferase family 2
MLAPIALFAYDRHTHLMRVIESLQKNALAPESELIIYSDAPKTQPSVDGVNLVRSYIANIEGFKKISIVEREENLGLAKSIISGVTEILERYERIIVLEDDLVVSPFFLDYMNEGLEQYEDKKDVVCIHGYVYPCQSALPNHFFLRGADCWGWGTWKESWKIFNPDGHLLLNKLKEQGLTNAFDFDGTYPFTQMLSDQIDGKNDSWAIRWYASAYLMNKLTLYPGESLVSNIGNDGSGSHMENSNFFDAIIRKVPVKIGELAIEESVFARNAFANYFLGLHKVTSKGVIYKLRKLFGMTG